jgi:hypothetical protein
VGRFVTLNRYAARKDPNQSEIVAALREFGCVVWDIGWPVDLLVRPPRGTHWLPMEVKNPLVKWALTEDQVQFTMLAGECPVAVVTDVESALRAVRAVMGDAKQEPQGEDF